MPNEKKITIENVQSFGNTSFWYATTGNIVDCMSAQNDGTLLASTENQGANTVELTIPANIYSSPQVFLHHIFVGSLCTDCEMDAFTPTCTYEVKMFSRENSTLNHVDVFIPATLNNKALNYKCKFEIHDCGEYYTTWNHEEEYSSGVKGYLEIATSPGWTWDEIVFDKIDGITESTVTFNLAGSPAVNIPGGGIDSIYALELKNEMIIFLDGQGYASSEYQLDVEVDGNNLVFSFLCNNNNDGIWLGIKSLKIEEAAISEDIEYKVITQEFSIEKIFNTSCLVDLRYFTDNTLPLDTIINQDLTTFSGVVLHANSLDYPAFDDISTLTVSCEGKC